MLLVYIRRGTEGLAFRLRQNINAAEFSAENCSPYQGCRVGVETRVGVGRSRPFWLELETELESVKFGRLGPQPGVG